VMNITPVCEDCLLKCSCFYCSKLGGDTYFFCVSDKVCFFFIHAWAPALLTAQGAIRPLSTRYPLFLYSSVYL